MTSFRFHKTILHAKLECNRKYLKNFISKDWPFLREKDVDNIYQS
jgi:hypothetical protein